MLLASCQCIPSSGKHRSSIRLSSPFSYMLFVLTAATAPFPLQKRRNQGYDACQESHRWSRALCQGTSCCSSTACRYGCPHPNGWYHWSRRTSCQGDSTLVDWLGVLGVFQVDIDNVNIPRTLLYLHVWTFSETRNSRSPTGFYLRAGTPEEYFTSPN